MNGSNQVLLKDEIEDDYATGHGLKSIQKTPKSLKLQSNFSVEDAKAGNHTKIMPYQSIESQGSLEPLNNSKLNSRLFWIEF